MSKLHVSTIILITMFTYSMKLMSIGGMTK